MAEPRGGRAAKRTVVIDLGSNSFRLVVFTAVPGAWWQRTDEIHEVVRIGAGMDRSGHLQREPMARALQMLDLYAHFMRANDMPVAKAQAVATSAIREAANREEFVARARETTGLVVRVLSREEEARFGYLAAVNSTTLEAGAVLDLGGGSLQLTEVRDRQARRMGSWRLGAVRMTERFLPEVKASKKQIKALRAHVARKLDGTGWLRKAPAMVGVGGTVRNLAVAAQREGGLPSFGVQGFVLQRDKLGELIEMLADLPANKRGEVPGIKPERGDVILAGAIVLDSVLEAGGCDAIEVTEAGLREGVFFSSYLAPTDPPLFESVREASVRNLAAQHGAEFRHVEHVASLALEMFDSLARENAHPGEPVERELLWAAAMLHDIGMTIDYDDHHKHSRYLILNAGLPGYDPRETALVAQMARYHRKGNPALGDFAPLAVKGDEELLVRCAALLRLAEQLERSRDQLVRRTKVSVDDGQVRLKLVTEGDSTVSRWAAERHLDLFEQAFGRQLTIAA